MARRGFFSVAFTAPEEPERTPGSVRFADPSKAEFARHIHTYNEPYSPRSKGEQNGIDTPRRYDYNGEGQWRAMNRKRGVSDEDDSDKRERY